MSEENNQQQDAGDQSQDNGNDQQQQQGDQNGQEQQDQGTKQAGDQQQGDQSQQQDQGNENKDKSLLDSLGENEGVDFDFSTGEKPEGFPDDYWDAENNTPNAQKLFEDVQKNEKIAKDLRAKMGKGEHKAPEKAEDYSFTVDESLADLLPSDDPALTASKDIAHKHGISQEAYEGFMGDMTMKLAELAQDMAENPPQMSEEQIAEFKKAEFAKIGENAPAVIRAVETFGKEMHASGMFSEGDLEAFKSMAVTGDQVRVLNKFRGMMGGSDIPMDMTSDGLPSDAEIADVIDKAYQSGEAGKIREAEGLLDKRRQAGRPERLQF